jgi:hypothetical protein
MSYRNQNLPEHVDFDSDDTIDEVSTEKKNKDLYRKILIASAIAVVCYMAYQYRGEISNFVTKMVSTTSTAIHDMEASAFGDIVETPGIMDM